MLLQTLQETREHTASYYAASAKWTTKHQPLQGSIEADVCIVGGGFSGVSSALHLAERGYSVVLLEANRIGWGATGRNGGQVIGGIGHNPAQFERHIGRAGVRAIWEMGVECVDIIRERVAKYQIDCDLRWGYCDVALKPSHLRDFVAYQKAQEASGYPHKLRLLDAEETRGLVKSERYIGGLLDETGNGHVHPLNLCLGEARAAEQLGTRIYEQSRVQKIDYGPHPVVHTEQGQVKARQVVLCGNAYLGRLVPRLASRVLPAASFIIATEPLGERERDVMTRRLAVCDPRTVLDYYRLSADGRLLFGGMSNYSGLAPRDVTATMRGKMLKVFPQLADVRIDYTWGGQMGIGLNRMPQLGRLHGNVYYAQAYSGHGVAPTHMMGKLIADSIAGVEERFDVFARIPHRPFPGGRLLRRPALALGMLYYRLKDLL
jgi:glycine/D-amino acid oxidase-like deaminating enzyme